MGLAQHGSVNRPTQSHAQSRPSAADFGGKVDPARPKHDRSTPTTPTNRFLGSGRLAASPGLRGLLAGSKAPSRGHREKRRTMPLERQWDAIDDTFMIKLVRCREIRPKTDVAQQSPGRTAILITPCNLRAHLCRIMTLSKARLV